MSVSLHMAALLGAVSNLPQREPEPEKTVSLESLPPKVQKLLAMEGRFRIEGSRLLSCIIFEGKLMDAVVKAKRLWDQYGGRYTVEDVRTTKIMWGSDRMLSKRQPTIE